MAYCRRVLGHRYCPMTTSMSEPLYVDLGYRPWGFTFHVPTFADCCPGYRTQKPAGTTATSQQEPVLCTRPHHLPLIVGMGSSEASVQQREDGRLAIPGQSKRTTWLATHTSLQPEGAESKPAQFRGGGPRAGAEDVVNRRSGRVLVHW